MQSPLVPSTQNLDEYKLSLWERNDGPYNKAIYLLIDYNTKGTWTYKLLKTIRIPGNDNRTDMAGTHVNTDTIFIDQEQDIYQLKVYKGGFICNFMDNTYFMSTMSVRARKDKLPTRKCNLSDYFTVHPQGWIPGRSMK